MTAAQQATEEERELAATDQHAGRRDRFSELVERQSRFLFRVAYALLRNTHDAEDVVQDAFLKLHRTGAWERMADERSFLSRTVWRLAVQKLPRKQTGAPDEEMPSPAASPEEAAISADWNAAVHRLMDALPEELRQPLALSAVEELTSREIGELLGIPEGTVRRRVMRARQILKEKLAARMGGRYEA